MIVISADFNGRYDASERALILAHEAMHARRGDGWWCLLAQFVAALFWFHPLAWRALRVMRHDQELACDAAVMLEHGKQRNIYANAMLKTQTGVSPLPVGCLWTPRHPITERIAILKLSRPGKTRRLLGSVFLVAFAVGAASAVYAASDPIKPLLSNATALYQMAVHISRNGETLATPTVCVKAESRRVSEALTPMATRLGSLI